MLRTLDDARTLRDQLDGMPKVVVIGAGFIGAEVAATCRGRGLDVTVLEALPQKVPPLFSARWRRHQSKHNQSSILSLSRCPVFIARDLSGCITRHLP